MTTSIPFCQNSKYPVDWSAIPLKLKRYDRFINIGIRVQPIGPYEGRSVLVNLSSRSCDFKDFRSMMIKTTVLMLIILYVAFGQTLESPQQKQGHPEEGKTLEVTHRISFCRSEQV
eukprot:TRINITY_DN89_c0_g2_i9.p1 TRINITY_DN89_c0_g2~~TRINITY_DN89_c0_g2_i9.p1  ORF type:complete len:116 (-),score=6.69 TRINITY_DN89_c0_g2_i9:1062-1409(-)